MIVPYRPRNGLLRPCDCLLAPSDGPPTTSGSHRVCSGTCTVGSRIRRRRSAIRTQRLRHRTRRTTTSHRLHRATDPRCSAHLHHWPSTCTREPGGGSFDTHACTMSQRSCSNATQSAAPAIDRSAWSSAIAHRAPRIGHTGPENRTHRSSESDAMTHRSDRSVQTNRHPQPAHRTARHRR